MEKITGVLLAAGIGSRLGDLTKDVPKPLVTVHGRSIIDYAIRWVRDLGASRVVVVGGYKAPLLEQAVRSIDPTVHFALNPDFATTHRMASLLKAEPFIEGDLLIQDADYVYSRSISRVIQQTACTEVMVYATRERSRYTAQDVIAETDADQHLQNIYKTPGTVPLKPNDFYFNSLVRVPQEQVSLFLNIGKELIQQAGNGMVQIEDTILEYARRGNSVKIVDAGEPLWVEVDNPDELAAAHDFVTTAGFDIP